MRRADRLFELIQVLRRAHGPLTAAAIGAELETGQRTVYRDIAALVGQRVPIRGEAGVGYVLDRDYDMPPLMLTPDEIEAAVLGAQWVAGRGDPALAGAARSLMAKIATAVPERLRPFILEPAVGAPPALRVAADGLDVVQARAAIRGGRKIHLQYRDEAGVESTRTVWPVILGYADTVRLLAAWCELRQAFRHFRTDRITRAEFLDDRYPARPTELRNRWRHHLAERRAARLSSPSSLAGRKAAESKDARSPACA